MELYLTRQRNGLYMLTKLKPVMIAVEGRNYEDAYIIPGEPVGMRNFCDLILKLVGVETPLKRGQSIKIELSGKVLEMLQ